MVDRGAYLPRSSDERVMLIKAAREDGYCVVVSRSGVWVDGKEGAIQTFRMVLCEEADDIEDDTSICSIVDPQGHFCIGAYANNPGAVYLYGVSEADFLAATADLRSDTLQ